MKRYSAWLLATVLAGALTVADLAVSAPTPSGNATTPAKPGAKGKKQQPEAAPAPADNAAAAAPQSKQPIETEARNAFILDMKTGAVLLDKAADERIAPASMSKMMTYYTAFTYLKEGKASLDDMLPVSEKAWR